MTVSKRRGRRPAGEETRDALVSAARELFSERGYEEVTVREIGTRAGVDGAMVNHWFGGKAELFAAAVLRLPFDPDELLARMLAGDPAQLPERVVRTFVTIWDGDGGTAAVPLLRNVTTQPAAADVMRDLMVRRVMTPVLTVMAPGDAEPLASLRANLCVAQLLGVGMTRYVLRFEPIASADVETIVAAVAPTIRRYLNDDIASEPE